jgi:DNA repair exonuclease SbcCD ATPase subunit
MALTGPDSSKFEQLCKKTYKDQAIWFLNAYWHTFGQKEAETIWNYKHKCDQLDLEKKNEGCALDELNAHRWLEGFKQPMTVKEMRDALRASGASEKFSSVPITHFLVTIYKANWKELVNASQGDNKEEIERAQKMLEAVQVAFRDSEAKATAAAEALREAQTKESDAKKAEADAKTKESEAEAAKKELEAALAVLKREEDAYNSKTEELKNKSENAGGVVAQNKAKAELAQHLASPTLPLQKAKITTEAAVKKSEKARQAATDSRVAAEAATQKAIEARASSERAKAAAEDAVEEARKKVDEAEAFLQEVKAKPGNAQGALWWIERELHEARAYLPTAKGGYAKKSFKPE